MSKRIKKSLNDNSLPYPKANNDKVKPNLKENTLNGSFINYWLMKAEPDTRLVKGIDVKFSIDDLASLPNQTSGWEGVRNYEARNTMRDQMKLGDKVLFYHSNCKLPGIAGIAEVVKEGYPDETAKDPNHPYYDIKMKLDQPNRWYMVDIKFQKKFTTILPLKVLKGPEHLPTLKDMVLMKRPQLSVQPVSKVQFDYILKVANSL